MQYQVNGESRIIFSPLVGVVFIMTLQNSTSGTWSFVLVLSQLGSSFQGRYCVI